MPVENPFGSKTPPVAPTAIVKKEETKIEDKPKTRADILKEFNYRESDIPIGHEYWKLPR